MSRKKQVKPRNSYSLEFKKNAVKLSMKKGVSVKDVAEELGVSPQYLSKWRADYRKSQSSENIEERVDAIAESNLLRDEVKRLKTELEIVKKAAVYFASQK